MGPRVGEIRSLAEPVDASELTSWRRRHSEPAFRRAGRKHHLGVGYTHRGTRILAITDDTTLTVINLTTGEILSTHDIDPDKTYWRNTQRTPGRWPGAR